MKANTIYLLAIISAVLFIIIFAFVLLLLKPDSKYKTDRRESQTQITLSDEVSQSYQDDNNNNNTLSDTKIPRQTDRPGTVSPGDKQPNKYEYNDDNNENQMYDQRDDNSYDSVPDSDYNSEPIYEPKANRNSGPKMSSFSENCVVYHNKFRSKHRQTNPVLNSQKLANSAQRKAQLMAATDDFSHSPDYMEEGENLWYFRISQGSAQLFPRLDCSRPSTSWYDEERVYNYQSPTQSYGVVGHFTQMVWRSTKQMGCAKSHSQRTGKIYVVCHYTPGGNIVGRFTENVLRKI